MSGGDVVGRGRFELLGKNLELAGLIGGFIVLGGHRPACFSMWLDSSVPQRKDNSERAFCRAAWWSLIHEGQVCWSRAIKHAWRQACRAWNPHRLLPGALVTCIPFVFQCRHKETIHGVMNNFTQRSGNKNIQSSSSESSTEKKTDWWFVVVTQC